MSRKWSAPFVPREDDFWLTYTAPRVEVRINQRYLEQANGATQKKLLRALSPSLGAKQKRRRA